MQSPLTILRTLQELSQRPHAPFYTPGHKRGVGASAAFQELLGAAALQADLPELPELDNLFAPEGAIAAAEALAAQTFGAEQTWFLVNGSTSGIIAAILATCGPGEKILVPRNLHQSVVSGLILSGADPVFVQPPYDPVTDLAYGLTAEAIAAALQTHPDVRAVLVLYPTYHGVCSDLGAIAALVHDQNLPLIVDEAHGAHFAFHPELPPSALSCGADLVVQSTHKTLGALTQAAMLHRRGDRVAPQRISRALQLVQSTSPSYLLLASLEAATVQMAEQGTALMAQTLQLAQQARTQLSQLTPLSKGGRGDQTALSMPQSQQTSQGRETQPLHQADSGNLQSGQDSMAPSNPFTPLVKGGRGDQAPPLKILIPPPTPQPGFAHLDRTRLTVLCDRLGNGFALDEQLHEQLGVTAELPLERHLTFIISLGNTAADIEQLVQAFKILIQNAPPQQESKPYPLPPTPLPTLALSPRQACFAATQRRSLPDAVDEICAEIICPYPPGIPILMPGEVITAGAIAYLEQIQRLGGRITGLSVQNTVQVVASPAR
ncbi:MAG: aminotransferase class I/II-fold pyridoxal phosphate-dependent enzyme [Spirulinaceae cyanobacterium]